MPSSFHGINMASNALRAFQRGMDITGHNLSNVNTRGYSRQTMEYGALDPMSFWNNRQLSLGQGVGIESINRIRDTFLDSQMQAAQGDAGRFQTLSTALRQIQPVFNEPGPNGISAALDRFWNSWSGLASNPNDPAARIEVQQAGSTLASRVRNTFQSLATRRNQLTAEMQSTVEQVNNLSSRVATLNREIRESMVSGGVPNDLLDQRDVAVEELSKLVNVNTFQVETGEVTVHFGGYPLVDTTGNHAFPSTLNASAYTASNGTHTFNIRGGKLYGLMEAANKVEGYMTSLDTLANTLREQVNTPHASGTNLNGTTGINFFVANAWDPQNGAIDFDISVEVRADIKNIAAGISGAPGDGGLATSLSKLRDVGLADLGNTTFGRFFSTMIGQVGRDVQHATDTVATQDSILGQIEAQRQSVSGVSIDDEMANMLRLQRSYQAAAKTLSMFDQMTEELIGLIR